VKLGIVIRYHLSDDGAMNC